MTSVLFALLNVIFEFSSKLAEVAMRSIEHTL
jgi:hypothetical protein